MRDNKLELIDVLRLKPGYLKKGTGWLADKFGTSLDDAREALTQVRNESRGIIEFNEPIVDVEQTLQQKVNSNIKIVNKDKGLYKLLIISDIHGVFVDHKAWQIVLEVIKNNNFDEIVLNGDILDFPFISKHDKKLFLIPVLQNYSEVLEIEFTKKVILKPLREAAPNTKIVFRLGNHEERLTEGKYTVAAERLAKLFKHYNSSELDQMLELDSLDIEYDPSECRNYFDKFDVVHGLSLAKTAPRNNINMYMGSGTSGHSHRLNSTYVRNKKHPYIWVESGCLRTVDNVEYLNTAMVADWMQGFVTVVFDSETEYFYTKTHPIVNGSCEFNGIVYK